MYFSKLSQALHVYSQVATYYGYGKLSPTYRTCYIVRFHRDPSRINFNAIFAEPISDSLRKAVIEELERHAPHHVFERMDTFEVGDLMLLTGKCKVTLHPSNYTGEDLHPTITPSQPTGTTPSMSKYRCIRST